MSRTPRKPRKKPQRSAASTVAPRIVPPIQDILAPKVLCCGIEMNVAGNLSLVALGLQCCKCFRRAELRLGWYTCLHSPTGGPMSEQLDAFDTTE